MNTAVKMSSSGTIRRCVDAMLKAEIEKDNGEDNQKCGDGPAPGLHVHAETSHVIWALHAEQQECLHVDTMRVLYLKRELK